MNKNICVFEDRGYSRFVPVSYTRAAYEIKCGMGSLLEKITSRYEKVKFNLFCRDYLKNLLFEKYHADTNPARINGDCLFINGRIIMDTAIPVQGEEEMGVIGDTLVYARLTKKNAAKLKSPDFLQNRVVEKLADSVKIKNVKAEMLNYIWETVHKNTEQIKKDFKFKVKKGKIAGKLFSGVTILEKGNIYIEKGAKIYPGVVIDAQGGPVYIDEGATVMPNAVILGPAYIGRNSLIKSGTKIYGGTTIGNVCKVGGEVTESIIHGYSNKQHEGFLGHSYMGKWINLAAATDNSDLKNNYTTVKVIIDNKYVDTGSMFVGMFVGDYTRTGIGAKLYSGTIVGVMCNILGLVIPQRYIPSFVWEEPGRMVAYEFKKGIETLKNMMFRRNVKLTSTEEKVIQKVYEITEQERMHSIKGTE